MCRNIKTLFNFEPPATKEEIRASSIQFVRKISGTSKPSRVNAGSFDQAVEQVEQAVTNLLAEMVTSAPTRGRE